MKKRLISLTLAAVMGMSLLVGCGGTNNQTETKESTPAKVETESTAVKESEAAKPAEVENISILYYGTNDQPAQDAVIKAMNEYSKEKIGVTVTFKGIASGEYTDTVSRALAAKEDVDLVWADVTGNRVINWANDGGLLEISELLPKYPELVAVMPERIWNSVKLSNGSYFIPNYKETGTGYSVAAPKAIVDAVKTKTGIDWNTIEMNDIWDLANFEEYILAAMDEGIDMPLPDGASFLTWLSKADPKYEGTTMPFVIDKEAGKVYNALEAPEVAEFVAMLNDWKDKGIWKEEQVMSDFDFKPYCKSGSYAMIGWVTVPDSANNLKDRYGVDCYVREVTDNIITSNSALGSGWAIAAHSKKADACMKWLQLVNTDAAFADIWLYGVEGTHYTREADGSVTKVADSGWSNSAWKATNAWVMSLQSSEAADKKEQYTAFNESAVESEIMGFRADFSKVSAELAAVTAKYKEQSKMLGNGFIDAAGLETLIKDLKAAGSDTIVAELQAQLDAFLAK